MHYYQKLLLKRAAELEDILHDARSSFARGDLRRASLHWRELQAELRDMRVASVIMSDDRRLVLMIDRALQEGVNQVKNSKSNTCILIGDRIINLRHAANAHHRKQPCCVHADIADYEGEDNEEAA